jgi:branched-chain amino acid transport system ATP-binding protein
MLLDVQGIDTYYGVFQALFQVSLSLEKEEVTCLLGRNGAGKTTTLKSIVGTLRPRSGSIKFEGEELVGKRPYQIVRLGIGFVPEDRLVFSGLTVRENLELGRRGGGRRDLERALERVYSLFPQLKTLEGQAAGTLSGGEQQMLTIGRTLMGAPKLILLDEPTAGLAPLLVQTLGDQITRLKEEGITVLLTEQDAFFALEISQKAHVIDKGMIVYEGAASMLVQDPQMMRDYLGV